MSSTKFTTYTDEQVDALVNAAAELLVKAPVSNESIRPMRELEQALMPFRTDPDAEMIEAIAVAIADDELWYALKPEFQERYRVQATNALAAFRKHTNGGAK